MGFLDSLEIGPVDVMPNTREKDRTLFMSNMMEKALLVVVALFPISEIVLAVMKRSRGGRAQNEDRGSMRLLWLTILVGTILKKRARLTHLHFRRVVDRVSVNV